MISHPLLEKYDWTITNDGIGPLKIGQTRSSIHLILHPFFQEKYKQYADYLPFPTDVVEELGIRIAYNKEGHCYYISIEQPMASSLVIPEHLDRYAAVKCRRSFDQKILSVRVVETGLLRDYGLERQFRCVLSTQGVGIHNIANNMSLGLHFGEGILEISDKLSKKNVMSFDIVAELDSYKLCSQSNKVILYFRSPGIFSSAEFVLPECPSVGGNYYFAGSYDDLSSWLRNIDPGVVEKEDRIVSYKKGLTVFLASSGDRTAPPRSVMYSSEYELGRFRDFDRLALGWSMTGYIASLISSKDIDELVQERFALLSENDNNFRYFGASELNTSSELDRLGKQGDTFRQFLCQSPERLSSYQEEFLRRNIFHYPLVFLNAPEKIRDGLLALLPCLVEEDVQKLLGKIPRARTYRLLESLAWIGDEEVRRFFSTLPQLPRPIWSHEEEEGYFSSVDTLVDFKHLPHRAGWELLPEGGRRELVFWQRLGIAPALSEEQLRTATSKFLSVQKGVSELSGAPLLLYFKIDLTDPRFHFLGIEGTSLRLITDPFCITQGHFKLTSEGGCTFVPADDLSVPKYTEGSLAFPEIPHTVSPLPTSPYNTSDGAGITFASYVGGLPYSNGFLHYPRCPECTHRMMFFMYFGGMGGDMKDGLNSLLTFLCRECLIAKVIENDFWQ